MAAPDAASTCPARALLLLWGSLLLGALLAHLLPLVLVLLLRARRLQLERLPCLLLGLWLLEALTTFAVPRILQRRMRADWTRFAQPPSQHQTQSRTDHLHRYRHRYCLYPQS